MRVILFSTLIAAAMPALANTPYVVGGAVTSDYQSTVALYWDGEFGCTGTIVASDRVMTAAHCLEGGPPPSHVMIGDTLGSGHMVPVRDGWMHPDYDFHSEFAADIAVLLLDDDVSAISIPIDRTPAAQLVNERFIYAGYGDTQGTGGEGKRKAASAWVTEVEGDVLVAETEDGGACFGDSGGPLYRQIEGQLHVMGVVSFGYTDDCFDAGGNTRTDIYADWVLTSSNGSGAVTDGGAGSNNNDDDRWDTGSWDTDDWNNDGSDERVHRGLGCSSVSPIGVPRSIAGLGLLFLMGRRRTQDQG